MTLSEEIIQKFNLAPNSYYPDCPDPYKAKTDESTLAFEIKERALSDKFAHRVAKGWYGISLGSPTPDIWLEVLDYLLTRLETLEPEYKILQQKIKFGRYCGYFEYISKETQDEIRKLEDALFDKKLRY